MRVSEPLMGPACRRSSALPAATFGLLVNQEDRVHTRAAGERARRGSAYFTCAKNGDPRHARSFYMGIAKCRVGQKFLIRQALKKCDEVIGFRRQRSKNPVRRAAAAPAA